MKKKFKILILIFLILNSFTNYVLAAPTSPRCYDLFDQIKAEWREKKLYHIQTDRFIDFGFEAEQKYESNEFINLRSEKNHLIVGQINNAYLLGKVKRGDIIISIGKTDTSKVTDKESYSFFEKFKDKQIVKFSRNGKEFELELEKITRDKQDEVIYTSINNISNVDIKDSTFTINMGRQITNYIDASSTYNEDVLDPPVLGDIILDNLIYKNEKNEWDQVYCNNIAFEIVEKLRIPTPGAGITIDGVTSLNKNLINSYVAIAPYSPRVGDDEEDLDYASIVTNTEGTYVIQNDFNLQTFPFDRQILKITYLAPEYLETYELSNNISTTTENLEFFVKNNKINGWDIIGFDLFNEIEPDGSGKIFSSATIANRKL